jgi:AcrR family transcriptional regulator
VTERAEVADSTDTRTRIIQAGARCITREGVTGASMAAIAEEAGVSKALLHYHYHDRATLLAEIAERIGSDVVERERAAVDESGGTGGLDALWGWLEDELRRGELAALVTLSLTRLGKVRHATRTAATERRRSAARTIKHLFTELDLAPRIPAALLADAAVAFVDGLALDVANGTARDPRISYDIFWLALLGLTE